MPELLEKIINQFNNEIEKIINDELLKGWGEAHFIDTLEGLEVKNIVVTTDGVYIIFNNGDVNIKEK